MPSEAEFMRLARLECIFGATVKIIYHPQSGWFEDTPLKGGTEAGYPLKGVEERTSLVRLRSVRGTTTALL